MGKASDGEDTAARFIPARPTIRKRQIAAAGCTACHLWKTATETVFGEGKQSSTVMFIGEQPGNAVIPSREDGEESGRRVLRSDFLITTRSAFAAQNAIHLFNGSGSAA